MGVLDKSAEPLIQKRVLVLDITALATPTDIENAINGALARGYEVVQVFQFRTSVFVLLMGIDSR